ncbi:MAG TPA: alpha amylase C-terminal domain-containing protein, partial [Steroidobacteraceae bacterium]|nr:alpha amylase C-terminal domain-containing protein [Steroidobacteraceae bacterium]
FEWVDCNDTETSVLSFLRSGNKPEDVALIVCNFTPVPRDNYRVGIPRGGRWRERLNSDAHDYGGSGIGNFGSVESSPLASHGRYYSLTLRLPPLSILLLTPE